MQVAAIRCWRMIRPSGTGPCSSGTKTSRNRRSALPGAQSYARWISSGPTRTLATNPAIVAIGRAMIPNLAMASSRETGMAANLDDQLSRQRVLAAADPPGKDPNADSAKPKAGDGEVEFQPSSGRNRADDRVRSTTMYSQVIAAVALASVEPLTPVTRSRYRRALVSSFEFLALVTTSARHVINGWWAVTPRTYPEKHASQFRRRRRASRSS